MPTDTDVLIVGAGPTGLLLAGDLAEAGVRCTVLERRDKETNLTRAFVVHARTLELLDARGVADRLVRTGRQVGTIRVFRNIRIDFSRLPTRFPFLLVTPQYQIERILLERARALGAQVETGAEVVGLRQDDDDVEAEVRTAGGATHRRRAQYLVGTDGVHSTVRRSLGLPFPGRSVVRSVMMCDVRMTDPPEHAFTANAVGDAFAFVVPFGDGWYRVIAWDRRNQLPDTAMVDVEEVRAVMRRALGSDHGMGEPRWLTRFHSDERQVPRYRYGRVFLAGDAAHVHSPAGGMGMNTGVQDAANLGWKLAAVIKGRAPEDLLDTYHAERYPVGRHVVRLSGALLRGALTRSRVLRIARGVLIGTASHVRWITRRMTGALSGIDMAYPAPPGAHPLTGRRAPDVPLAGNGPHRLYEALRSGRFLLVTPHDRPVPASLSGGWGDRVAVVTAGGPTRAVVLVRPDGYIAWANDDADPGDRAAAIRAALTEWCGESADTFAH